MSTFKGIDTIRDLQTWLPATVVSRTVPEKEEEKQPFAAPDVWISKEGRFFAIIPALTRSETNEPKWVQKMRRKLSAKEACRRTIGPYLALLVPFAKAYHAGKTLLIIFTRLGGRRLDPCNLPSSMKVVEDMIAGALLANDGSPIWQVTYQQEPGGQIGVKVTIEIIK